MQTGLGLVRDAGDNILDFGPLRLGVRRCEASGLGFRGFGFVLGFRVQGLGARAWGLGFRVWGRARRPKPNKTQSPPPPPSRGGRRRFVGFRASGSDCIKLGDLWCLP